MHRHVVGLLAMMLSLGLSQATWGIQKEEIRKSTRFEPNAWFMENKGQIKDQLGRARMDIDFRLRAHGGLSVFVSNQGLTYQWYFPDDSFTYRMEAKILGANPQATFHAEQAQSYKENYYLSGQSLEASSWSRIVYKDIYPQIDWVIYKKGNQLEYDFIVHPGGNVNQIKWVFEGADQVELDELGGLVVRTPYTEIRESAPVAFLENEQTIDCQFILNGDTLGFQAPVEGGYLRIDPIVSWGTYLGGNLNDLAHSVKRSVDGHVYITGGTASLQDIATTGAYMQSYQGGTGGLPYQGDAFLAKFDSLGNCLWSTYFGGTGEEQANTLALDGDHSVYIAGFTRSNSGLSTPGAHQASLAGGADAFLAKFRADGTLNWSTYYGGTGDESLWITLSASPGGPVYLGFPTNSTAGIASPGTHQELFGGFMDAGLVQFDSSGAFQWGTYFGGTGMDVPFQLRVDEFGHLYVAGFTGSTTQIAGSSSHQGTHGGGDDGFLAKFNDQGSVIWSTYYGSTGSDRFTAVYPVGDSAVYLLGSTNSSTGIATAGAHQTNLAGGEDAFIVRLDTAGQRAWATYFGGPSGDNATPSLALGAHGDLYFGGLTQSTSGIASSGAIYQTIQGIPDAMLGRITQQGQLVWSTYLGGPGIDVIQSMDADPYGYLYLCGETTSGTNIADSNAHQSSFGGGYRDAMLMAIADCDTPATPGIITGPAAPCRGQAVTYMVSPVIGAEKYIWTLPPGWVGSSQSNQITVYPGSQPGTLSVQAQNYCLSSPASSIPVQPAIIAQISVSGDDRICPTDSVELVGVPGADAYIWYHEGVPISSDSSIFVQDSGRYQLIVSGLGCTDSSAYFDLKHWPMPQPSIQYDGTHVSTDQGFTSYQWYFNDQIITGANQYQWKPVANGKYRVVVTDTNGCENSSSIYPLGIQDPGLAGIKVFPNPVSGDIQIHGLDAYQGSLTLINANGQTIWTHPLQPKVSMDAVQPGLYWIIIRDHRGRRLHSQTLVKD